MVKANNPQVSNLRTKVGSVTIDIVKKLWYDDNITCDVTLSIAKTKIVTIYGIRVIISKKGEFLSLPSRKGRDGKYYAHAYIEDEGILSAILETVTEG